MVMTVDFLSHFKSKVLFKVRVICILNSGFTGVIHLTTMSVIRWIPDDNSSVRYELQLAGILLEYLPLYLIFNVKLLLWLFLLFDSHPINYIPIYFLEYARLFAFFLKNFLFFGRRTLELCCSDISTSPSVCEV